MARFSLPRLKHPSEKFRISLDFKNDLKTGDTVASHAVTAKRTDTLADVSGTFLGTIMRSGTVVEAAVQDGTDGLDYDVTFQVTTTQGDIFEGVISVPVRA